MPKLDWQRDKERRAREKTEPFGGDRLSERDVAVILSGPKKADMRAEGERAIASASRLVVCRCGHRGRVPAGRVGKLRCSACGELLPR